MDDLIRRYSEALQGVQRERNELREENAKLKYRISVLETRIDTLVKIAKSLKGEK